jgi:hypothetical protein
MNFDIHKAIGKATRVLVIAPDGIRVFDRDESGRGHAWNGLFCLSLEEALQRLGYAPKRGWLERLRRTMKGEKR